MYKRRLIMKEDLLTRLKKYKYDTDITYKAIAAALNIPYATFYAFTGGTRALKPKYHDWLSKYLQEKGY